MDCQGFLFLAEDNLHICQTLQVCLSVLSPKGQLNLHSYECLYSPNIPSSSQLFLCMKVTWGTQVMFVPALHPQRF